MLPEQQSKFPLIVVYSTSVVYYLHSSESRPTRPCEATWDPKFDGEVLSHVEKR